MQLCNVEDSDSIRARACLKVLIGRRKKSRDDACEQTGLVDQASEA